MKKLISLLLALAMIVCFAAGCTTVDEDKNDGTTENVETPENNEDVENNENVENNEDVENNENTENADTMEALIGKIIEKNPVEFMGGAMALDLANVGELNEEDFAWYIKNYTGLDSADDISDAAYYEAMMGSIAFSLVAVRVNEGVDAEAVGQAMKDGIDPRKWICVGADQVMVAGCGDVVMLIMLDNAALGLTAQSYVDAFEEVCGADLSFTLN